MHDSLHCDIHFIAMVWNPTALRYACITIAEEGIRFNMEHWMEGWWMPEKKKNSPFL